MQLFVCKTSQEIMTRLYSSVIRIKFFGIGGTWALSDRTIFQNNDINNIYTYVLSKYSNILTFLQYLNLRHCQTCLHDRTVHFLLEFHSHSNHAIAVKLLQDSPSSI